MNTGEKGNWNVLAALVEDSQKREEDGEEEKSPGNRGKRR